MGVLAGRAAPAVMKKHVVLLIGGESEGLRFVVATRARIRLTGEERVSVG